MHCDWCGKKIEADDFVKIIDITKTTLAEAFPEDNFVCEYCMDEFNDTEGN